MLRTPVAALRRTINARLSLRESTVMVRLKAAGVLREA
jgi:hypothetical protein